MYLSIIILIARIIKNEHVIRLSLIFILSQMLFSQQNKVYMSLSL